jgi:hypothetical protein
MNQSRNSPANPFLDKPALHYYLNVSKKGPVSGWLGRLHALRIKGKREYEYFFV